jgi:hypothetical protein
VSEQDVREGLRVAVADEPPWYLDPDALIATARKAARRKRSLLSAGVATAVIAVAAVAVPVVLAVPPGPAPVATPPTSSTAPWPPEVAPKHYTAKQLAGRGVAMRGHVGKVLPSIVPAASAIVVGAFQGEAAGEVRDGQDYLNAFAVFTVDGGRYAVGINVFAPGAFTDGPADLCAPAPSRCTMLSDRLLAFDEPLGEGNTRLKILSVYDFRPDGSVTAAAAYNYDPTTNSKRVVSAELPLTVDQLTKLATDPALGL